MRKDGDFYPLFGEEAFHEAKCPHCGGAVELDPDGKHARCLYCKESFSIAGADPGGRWGQKLQEAIFDRNNYDFWLAEGTIENELPDLRDAIQGSEGEKRKRLRLLLSRFLYQLALCQYCVSHVDAGSIVEGKNEVERLEIPTLATKATKPFSENLRFKEAMKIAEEEGDGQLKEFYRHEAAILDGLVREAEEVGSRPGTRFDVFISYKADPENTEGQAIARAIFERLRGKGYSVFWSDPSAKLQRGGESFNAVIFQALFSARAFILVCTGKPAWYSGSDGRWIYNEWRRFLHRREVEKDPSLLLIPVLGKGFGVEDLHVRLRQAIQAVRTEGNAGWLESVVSSVESLDPGRMPRGEVSRISFGEEKAMDVISISSGKKFELESRGEEDERERNAVDRAKTNLELAAKQERGRPAWRRYVESARSALLHIPSEKLSLEGSELLFRAEYLLNGWAKETISCFDRMARIAYAESGGNPAPGKPYGLLLEETVAYFEPRKVNREAGVHLGIPVEKDLSWEGDTLFLAYIGSMPCMVPEDTSKYRQCPYFRCAEATWARLMAYPLPKDTEKVKALLRVIYPHLTHLERAEVVRRIDEIAARLLEESKGNPSRKRLSGELSALILKGEGFLGDKVPVRKKDPDALWIYHFSHSFFSRPNFLREKDIVPLLSKMVEGGYLLCEGGARNRLQQAFDAYSLAVVRSPFQRKKAVRCFLKLAEIVPYCADWKGAGSYAFLERAFEFAGHLIAKRSFDEAQEVLRMIPRKVALTTGDKNRLSCLLLLANTRCNCFEALVKTKKDLSSDEACSIGGEGNALLLYETVERAKSSKERLKYLRKIATIYSKHAYKTGSFRPKKMALEVFGLVPEGLKARLSYLKESGKEAGGTKKSSERKKARAAKRKSRQAQRNLRALDEAAALEAPITKGDRLATFAQSGSAIAAGSLSLIASLLFYLFLKKAPDSDALRTVGIFFHVGFAFSLLVLFLGLNSWTRGRRKFLNFLLAVLLTIGPFLVSLLFVYPMAVGGGQDWARPLLAVSLSASFAINGFLSLAAPGRSKGIKLALFIPFLALALLSLLVPVFLPLGLLG